MFFDGGGRWTFTGRKRSSSSNLVVGDRCVVIVPAGVIALDKGVLGGRPARVVVVVGICAGPVGRAPPRTGENATGPGLMVGHLDGGGDSPAQGCLAC